LLRPPLSLLICLLCPRFQLLFFRPCTTQAMYYSERQCAVYRRPLQCCHRTWPTILQHTAQYSSTHPPTHPPGGTGSQGAGSWLRTSTRVSSTTACSGHMQASALGPAARTYMRACTAPPNQLRRHPLHEAYARKHDSAIAAENIMMLQCWKLWTESITPSCNRCCCTV
jgi:hypothetical protein